MLAPEHSVKRRRECEACLERYTTIEVPQLNWPRVIKKDQRREQFLESKLRSGVLRAFEKLRVTTDTIEQTISHIKTKILASQEREVSTKQIGEWALDALKDVDAVAYIRFASVYRRFETIEEFYQVLDSFSVK
jgi:transcriptional repressor NrdR